MGPFCPVPPRESAAGCSGHNAGHAVDRSRYSPTRPGAPPSSREPTPAWVTTHPRPGAGQARRPTWCWPAGDAGRGGDALRRLAAAAPDASVELGVLDLADLASVRLFAETHATARGGPDLLVNNAGVMALPLRRTADGFEMQFGTNHLGHFALTGLLLPGLLGPARCPGGDGQQRHAPGRPDRLRQPQRRAALPASGARTASRSWRTCCSPWNCSTALDAAGTQPSSPPPRTRASPRPTCRPPASRWPAATGWSRWSGSAIGCSANPTRWARCRACSPPPDPSVRGGDYIGPDGPVRAARPPQAWGTLPAAPGTSTPRARLWDVSEDLTPASATKPSPRPT